MRYTSLLSLSFAIFITTGVFGAEPARLVLTDEELSIQEIRPLERHAWILTLDGKWPAAAKPGEKHKHYVNIIFPNGAVATHRVLSEDYAAKGEFRVVIQELDLIRNEVPRDAKLTIVISQDKGIKTATDPEVISEPFETQWPLDRPIVKRPVETRYSPREPIDAMPLPDDPLIKYKWKPKKDEMK